MKKMKKVKGRFTFLISDDKTRAMLEDDTSGNVIASFEITGKNTINLLSRVSHVECDVNLYDTYEDAGKKLETDRFEFEMPDNDYSTRTDTAKKLVVKKCPTGWVPDLYFGSQNSFFQRGGKYYAGCVIRRWV